MSQGSVPERETALGPDRELDESIRSRQSGPPAPEQRLHGSYRACGYGSDSITRIRANVWRSATASTDWRVESGPLQEYERAQQKYPDIQSSSIAAISLKLLHQLLK